MEMPTGLFTASVDDKGRLRLPTDVRRLIELHPEWFIVEEDHGLHLGTDASNGQPVEVDSTGRMLIPPELSSEFKKKEVRLILGPGQVEVLTAEEFEKRLATYAAQP